MKTALCPPCSIWIWQGREETSAFVRPVARGNKKRNIHIEIVHVGCFMNDNRIVLKRTNKRDAGGFLLFVFLLPYVCACLWGHVGEEVETLRRHSRQEETEQYRVRVAMNWGVWELPVQDYLTYKLETVMSGAYEREALKAQAVLLRTELVQMWKEEGTEYICVAGNGLEKWYGESGAEEMLRPYRQAVEETDRLYLCYQGEPVQASYFRISNGQTRNAEEVWHTKQCPYLTGVSCQQDKAALNYSSDVTVSKPDFIYEIQPRIGEEYLPQDLWEGIQFAYDQAGYVTEVTFSVDGKEVGTIDGETFRYLFSLPSASFGMERGDNELLFHVTGVGHGFGMSQYGANCRALNGETYDRILEEFFFGTELAKFE